MLMQLTKFILLHIPLNCIQSALKTIKCHTLFMRRHAIYYGNAAEAVDWFDKLGYRLPYRINAADFILDLASADVATDKRCVPTDFAQP